MREPRSPVGPGLLLVAVVLSLPSSSWASPPPDFSQPTDFLPTFVAMGLLSMVGIALGLLRARQRPGRLFVAVSILGALALAVAALELEPPIDTPYWTLALQLEAAALAGASLAAWVWGRGGRRVSRPRGGTALFALTGLLAAALWTAAIARSVTTPFQFGSELPEECGTATEASPPDELQSSDRWFDWRVARRSVGSGVQETIFSAAGGVGRVALLAVRQDGERSSIQVEQPIEIDGRWVGLAGDRRGRVFAAWASEDMARVTIARIGEDLRVQDARTWSNVPPTGSLELFPGAGACLAHSFWRGGAHQQRVLVVDASLRPRSRLAAVVSALRGGQAVPGWMALCASLAIALLVLARGLRLRRLARAPRWQGRVADDGVTLETAEGEVVRVPQAPARAGGWVSGQLGTVVGRRSGELEGGPYRGSATTVVPLRILAAAFETAFGELRRHEERVRLLAAAMIAVLSVSAIDLLVFG